MPLQNSCPRTQPQVSPFRAADTFAASELACPPAGSPCSTSISSCGFHGRSSDWTRDKRTFQIRQPPGMDNGGDPVLQPQTQQDAQRRGRRLSHLCLPSILLLKGQPLDQQPGHSRVLGGKNESGPSWTYRTRIHIYQDVQMTCVHLPV